MINKIKRIYIVLLLFILVFFGSFCPTRSAELYRLRPACFDLSNSVVFIPVKKLSDSGICMKDLISVQNVNENTIELSVKSAKTDNQPDNLLFSEGNLKEFNISQTDDNILIKLVFKPGYNLSNVKIGNINNNLIINFAPIKPFNMNYYINTYTEKMPATDYREYLTVSTKTIEKKDTILINNAQTNTKLKNEIDSAFQNSNQTGDEVYTNYTVEDLSKNCSLKSKYYIFDSKLLDDTFRIVGVGTVCVQKPFLLENPKRMVLDIPNSVLNPELHGKELILSNGDILKIAQFNPNTTRMVVTSEKAPQYIPVYSADSQSLQLANPQNILNTHLPKYKSNIIKFNYQKVNQQDNFLFEFDKPLIYAIKRTTQYLFIYFLNAEKYSDSQYKSAINNTPYSDMAIHLLSTGMRIRLPVGDRININTYISPDGKLFKLSSEINKAIIEQKKEQKIKELTKKEGGISSSPKYTDSKNKNIIVLDAGHGGKDCGALRGDILEKTITLDVCKKLQNILTKKGYKVYMTRTDDTYVSLEDRTLFTEGINPAAFVSVHVNACNAESPNGIETHYYNENSIELADAVHKNLIKHINTTNRGLFRSRFYVINHTTAPAILVEIGFISNDKERKELTTPQRQQATVEGIAEGIIEYIKNNK